MNIALGCSDCASGISNPEDNPRFENHPFRSKDCMQMIYHLRRSSEELNLEAY